MQCGLANRVYNEEEEETYPPHERILRAKAMIRAVIAISNI